MHSPAIAIAWQIWQKNRWGLMLAAAGLPASFVAWFTFGAHRPHGVMIFEFFIVLLSAVTIFWSFSFTETDARGRHSGYPSRMFVLPVRTVRLVSYPMLCGVSSILLFYFAWLGALFGQWKLGLPREVVICQASVLAAMMVSMQAIVWALHRFNWTRVFALVVVGGGLGVGAVLTLESGVTHRLTGVFSMVSGSILLLGFLGALIAVEGDRRGAWLGGLERAFQALLDALPRRHKPLASIAAAQFWMEWCRRGWFVGIAMGILMASSVFVLPMSSVLQLDWPMTMLNFSTMPFMVFWLAHCMGATLAKSDLWSLELAVHPITSVRPLSTGDMVVAKLKVAAVVTLLGWVVFAIMAWPTMRLTLCLEAVREESRRFWGGFPEEHRTLLHWAVNPVVLLTFLGVTWRSIVRGLCPSLAGRSRTNAWDVTLNASLLMLVAVVIAWCYSNPGHFEILLVVLPWVAGAGLVWKWGVAMRAFTRAYGESLYSRKQWRALVAVWIGLTAGVALSAYLGASAHQLPSPLILFLAVWLLPGGELARCATNLAQNRHR